MSGRGQAGANGRRVLVVGRSPAVMAATLAELAALGVDAEGDVDPERAYERADAASFDLVAVGRGVTGAARTRLRDGFRSKNPGVRLIDATFNEAAARIVGALDGRDPQGIDLDAYLARIGYGGPLDPTPDTLSALATAHLATIPFEALDVLSGRGVDLSPDAVEAKLVRARRGGYCYEQNGLFRRALAALGFEADALLARVRLGWRPGDLPNPRTHMALKVTLDCEAHLVDVGFGGLTPSAPLRLSEAGPQPTPHGRCRLTSYGPAWLLEAEVEGEWAPMYEVFDQPQIDADFEPANWFTATHPSSFFRRSIAVARTAPDARHALFGSRLTIRTPDGGVERRELSADEIEAALADIFGLPVDPGWRQLIGEAVLAGDGA